MQNQETKYINELCKLKDITKKTSEIPENMKILQTIIIAFSNETV